MATTTSDSPVRRGTTGVVENGIKKKLCDDGDDDVKMKKIRSKTDQKNIIINEDRGGPRIQLATPKQQSNS